MLRRGFLKMLGLAPAAAPALAKMGLDEALGRGPLHHYGLGLDSGAMPLPQSHPDESYIATEIREAKAWLARLGSQKAYDDLYREALDHPSALDPDLAAMRSFSASALVRMQADRRARRELESRRRSTVDRLADLMKRL